MAIDRHTQFSFFGGKGGVGKSTLALAYAIKRARYGTVKLVSTDPAHNLFDYLDGEISGTPIPDNLDVLEIDPGKEAENYIERVKKNIRGVVSGEMQQEAFRHIGLAGRSPGAMEAALLDRFIAILLDEGEEYDQVIFDTAPTGHTLRLLMLPDLMSSWVEGVIRMRSSLNENYEKWVSDREDSPADPVLEILEKRKDRIHLAHHLLQDPERTQFFLVSIPEKVPMKETERTAKQLREYGVPLHYLLLNKVLQGSEDGNFYQKRYQLQQKIKEEFSSRFLLTSAHF